MEQAIAQTRGKPGADDLLSDGQAFTQAYAGQFQLMRTKARRAVDAARRAGQPERAAQLEAAAAVREALLGNTVEARRSVDLSLSLSQGKDVQFGAAFALALIGDSARTQRLADELGRRFPEDTSVKYSYLPELHALIALSRGKGGDALTALRDAVPYEMGWPSSVNVGFYGALYPVYVRGNAYLVANRPLEAAAEFRKVLDHSGAVCWDPVITAASRYGLARAYTLAGDTENAKNAYLDFLTHWTNADPDIPILNQAKVEFSKL